jgi:hypothetical protein
LSARREKMDSRACEPGHPPSFPNASAPACTADLLPLIFLYASKTSKQITQEMFALGDGCAPSTKKDGMANIRGFLGTNDDLLRGRGVGSTTSDEGNPSFGALAVPRVSRA